MRYIRKSKPVTDITQRVISDIKRLLSDRSNAVVSRQSGGQIIEILTESPVNTWIKKKLEIKS